MGDWSVSSGGMGCVTCRPRRSTRDRSEPRQSLAPEARIAGIFIKTNTGAIKNTDKSVYL
jgi:hypothetical protein